MPANTFRAALRLRPGVAIIDLDGEINAQAEHVLNTAYAQAAATGARAILLNFAAVDYINSTGIALIVGVLAQTRKAGRTLLACGLSDHYVEIFEITRLADFMSIFPSEEHTLARVSTPA